jgi:RNA polymerase-binding transcription factor DksA
MTNLLFEQENYVKCYECGADIRNESYMEHGWARYCIKCTREIDYNDHP